MNEGRRRGRKKGRMMGGEKIEGWWIEGQTGGWRREGKQGGRTVGPVKTDRVSLTREDDVKVQTF